MSKKEEVAQPSLMKVHTTERYVRVRLQDPKKYLKIKLHDVGREGYSKRVAGYNSKTGKWETQAWIFEKDKLLKDKKMQQLYKEVAGRSYKGVEYV